MHQVKISQIKKKFMELDIKNTNSRFIVTLRRILRNYVPTFAFHHIEFETNESPFNDDEIKLRLHMIPVINLKTSSKIADEEYLNLIQLHKKNEEIELGYKDLPYMEMVINEENNSQETKIITNENAIFYSGKDLKKINTPYPKPFIITYLKPGQNISLTAKTSIGLGIMGTQWNPIYQDLIKSDKEQKNYTYSFHTYHEDPKKILSISLQVLIKKINIYKNYISSIEKVTNHEIIFNGEKYDFIPTLIEMMKDDNIIVISHVPHNDENKIIIKFSKKLSSDKIISIMLKYIKKFIDIIEKILKSL